MSNEATFPDVHDDNPYIFYLPTPVPLTEKNKTEFLKKVSAKQVKLLSIHTVNSLDTSLATEVILNVESLNGKKVIVSKVCLKGSTFFRKLPAGVADKLWADFMGVDWSQREIVSVKHADAFQFRSVQKLEVRFPGKSEETHVIFAAHFLNCPKAQNGWVNFVEMKLGKRDLLVSLEKSCQKYWDDNKIWQLDAVPGEEKWIATFPYPYMNGALHLGHAFTICKIDFATGYYRLKGKRTLFPFSFHCTGMPIKSCADKLKREIDTYGCPPDWNKFQEAESAKKVEESTTTTTSEAPGPAKRVTAKAAQKTSTSKSQWQIMQSLGLSDESIPAFADAHHWLEHFPERTMADLKLMGAKIDWRRSFITTDVNPFYDAFVRWQFNKLKKMDKVKFGLRPTIYSPADKQPCMDHDRQTGEGVGFTEYVLVKQELQKPYPAALKHLEDREQKVYLVPATLRPETMFGQTNCWVLPTGDYGAFEINDKEIFVCTPRAARNLAFQGYSKTEGVVTTLATFKGEALLGAKIRAPLSVYSDVYVLPMFTVKTSKTTGVVTSVPSDSPDDFAAYTDVKTKKDAMLEKYGITEAMFANDVFPIIEVPGYGNLCAPAVVAELKIKSQNDPALVLAKEKVYMKGFYEGKMIVEGQYFGMAVKDAKPLIRESLLAAGTGILYRDPDGEIISRSNDECVVALCDQWYLDYGEEHWQSQVYECLAKMNTFDAADEVRHQLKNSIDIIHKWACSRSYGLGSKIPWDPQYLVESLSDSTIYMAFYTISQILQGENNLNGQKPGPSGITPEQMTDEVFEFIFGDTPLPKTDIPAELLETAKREFNTWYPLDLRVTGKDLLPNHMVFWLYNHVAFFPPEKWPRGLKANGWLLLNGEKMAKRNGNFVTLQDACKRYGCDPMRFALATAGDGMDDPNFTVENVDTATLQIWTLKEWVEEMVAAKDSMKQSPPSDFAERLFDAEMNRLIEITDRHYSRLEFRDAVTAGFFDMQKVRDEYRKRVKNTSQLNWPLIHRFIRSTLIMMSPIISHTAEWLWQNVLGEEGSIFSTSFPRISETDQGIIRASQYISTLISNSRDFLRKKTQKAPSQMRVYAFTKVPEWTVIALELMNEYLVKFGTLEDSKDKENKEQKLGPFLLTHPELKKNTKKVMSFVTKAREEFLVHGPSALSPTLPFDELEILKENLPYLADQLGISAIIVRWGDSSDEDFSPETKDNLASGGPGNPLTFFTFQ